MPATIAGKVIFLNVNASHCGCKILCQVISVCVEHSYSTRLTTEYFDNSHGRGQLASPGGHHVSLLVRRRCPLCPQAIPNKSLVSSPRYTRSRTRYSVKELGARPVAFPDLGFELRIHVASCPQIFRSSCRFRNCMLSHIAIKL